MSLRNKSISFSLTIRVIVMIRFLLNKSSSPWNPQLSYRHRSFATIPNESNHSVQAQKGYSYADLRHLSLRTCEQLKTHNLFDEMPQRVSEFAVSSKVIHCQSVKHGFWSKGSIGNAILDLYAKCGDVSSATKVFDRLESRNVVAWNSMLSMYSKLGRFDLVLTSFGLLWNSGVWSNEYTFSIVLSGCAGLEDVTSGSKVHCIISKMGLESSSFCQGSLIDMYAKCGCVSDARRVFDVAIHLDTVSWTAMIAGYFRVGLHQEAINVFEEMKNIGQKPDQIAMVTAINAYVGMGRLDEASDLFSTMHNPKVVAWNVMISGHAQRGYEIEAIKIYGEMRKSSTKPSRPTFGSILCAIANLAALDFGLVVHAEAIKQGLHSNVYVGSSLINMYAKCKKMEASKKVFDDLDEQNVVLWNAMLGGYAQNGNTNEVIKLFTNMKHHGFCPDEFSYTSILSACACLDYVELGRQLHSVIVKNRFYANLFVGNALVDMYAKCGVLEDARQQFELIQNRDIVSWNAIIVGYVQEQDEIEAFCIFQRMISHCILPNEVSLATILSACANMKGLEQGKQVHGLSIKCGLETGLYAGSSLIAMYAKCGAIGSASKIFACMPELSLASMNAMIAGHAPTNLVEATLVFAKMQTEGLRPSEITFASLLDACDGPQTLNLGRQFHCQIIKSGIPQDDEFLGISLLGMYLCSLRKTEAILLFSDFSNPKSTILWTAMISGLTQNDCSEDALQYYQEMLSCNALPDQATFVTVLRACAVLSSVTSGRKTHALIFHTSFNLDELTCSSLVDMYAKCGDVNSSEQVFKEMFNRNYAISWNSMIVGFAKNGYSEDALRVFDQMKQTHVMPDDVTFLGVLTACSHTGRVSEGRHMFDTMVNHFGIQPRVDHCACMVDLLGRWGFLEEAEDFINKLNLEGDTMIWATMLGACTIHGDEIRGHRAAEKLIEMEPQSSSPYVLLSNIYAASGNWDDAKILRMEMREKGVKKLPGCSWIDVGQNTKMFVAGDKSHPYTVEMDVILKELTALMKKDGYCTQIDSFFHEGE